ncbi:MAG TPA: CopD family protein [Dongiaceae bacterium]|nr:CopD family protein [Dongiaceae bacterium]
MSELLGIFGFLVVLLRAVILCFQTVTIGGVFFLTVIANRPDQRSAGLLASSWKLIRVSALGVALAQFFFVVSNSLVLTASTDISVREVLGANFVWAGALAIVAALLVVFWPARLGKNTNILIWLPALAMLAATVMTSHSASRMEDRGMLVTLTALHYLATATWIGGLAYLLFAARAETGEARAAITRRFSRSAQISVAVLFLAGLGMSWVYVGSVSAMWGTAYGVMLGAKISLFLVLLILGAANFYIVKGIATDTGTTGAKSLLCFGEAEIGIGLSIILAAASMTSQPPSVDLLQDRVSMHEIAERFGPRTPRFSSPDIKEISESTNEIMKRAAAAGRPMPTSFVPGQSGIGTNTPADIAWSEYNHNCAGFVVFLMGMLALLSRSKYFSWAKIWPLAFLLLAVFLFFRADPENWPMGPNGFWESFAVADVLQHRAAVVLIIVFAIFQYRVETGRVKSMAAALVFPAVCAIGGVVLLTHTHALSNVKEELLAELSHTPLAIFGILAGWSRWLELRLPEQNGARKYLAWVWPVCFIFVGLILMDYHEADVRV